MSFKITSAGRHGGAGGGQGGPEVTGEGGFGQYWGNVSEGNFGMFLQPKHTFQ